MYFYFYAGVDLQAVRSGRWSFTCRTSTRPSSNQVWTATPGEIAWPDLPLSLFDLDADPGETTNLAPQYPAVVSQLMNAATAFDADLKMNLRPPGQL